MLIFDLASFRMFHKLGADVTQKKFYKKQFSLHVCSVVQQQHFICISHTQFLLFYFSFFRLLVSFVILLPFCTNKNRAGLQTFKRIVPTQMTNIQQKMNKKRDSHTDFACYSNAPQNENVKTEWKKEVRKRIGERRKGTRKDCVYVYRKLSA